VSRGQGGSHCKEAWLKLLNNKKFWRSIGERLFAKTSCWIVSAFAAVWGGSIRPAPKSSGSGFLATSFVETITFRMRGPVRLFRVVFLLSVVLDVLWAAVPSSAEPKLVVFVLDRVSLRDVMNARAPAIQKLLSGSAVGLMNTVGASARTPEAAYVTISAGAHAAATSQAGEFAGAWERLEEGSAWEVFLRRTGVRTSKRAILCLGLPSILNANLERATGATPGALGGMVSQLGRTACIGCPDAPKPRASIERFAPLLVMRRSGIVDEGDVSSDLLRPDPSAPFGVSTDPIKLERAFLKTDAAVVVVDLGETSRAEAYRPWLAPEAALHHRLEAVRRADLLVRRLMRHVNLRHTVVCLVSGFPPLSLDGRVETPGFVSFTGLPAGVLASSTTQTPGLIANIDILPTVAELLKLRKPEDVLLTGSPARVVPAEGHLQELCAFEGMMELERQMAAGPLAGVLGVIAGLLVLAASLVVVFSVAGRRAGEGARSAGEERVRCAGRLRACRCAVGVAALFPAVLVLVPLVQYVGVDSAVGYWVAAFGLWLVLSVPAVLLPSKALRYALAVVVLVVCAALILAAVGWGLTAAGAGRVVRVDAPWFFISLSVLSDFPLIGVRFHGLGNELMGVLIGSLLSLVCLTVSPARTAWHRFWLWLVAVGTAVFIGHPLLGDNAGGAASAVFGFGAAAVVLGGSRVRLKTLLGLGALAIGLVVGLAVFDAALGGVTHLGRTALVLKHQGAGYLWALVGRKLALNFSLAADPRALWFYAGVAVLVGVWTSLLPGFTREVLQRRSHLRRLVLCASISAAAAFLLNDTGVIPAGFVAAGAILAFAEALVDEASVAFAEDSACLSKNQ
jgi:hypothetical protein